ncbi:MAG: hypothetical protein JNK34_14330, partial [Tabrizicola sp.]|nr:hypothetical protein [Tabrizicola sp.]
AHNHAYEEAQAAVDAGNPPEHLANLWGAWKLLAAARAERDPLELELPERQVRLNDEGRIEEIKLRERLDAAVRERFGAELQKHLTALQPSVVQSIESWVEAELPQVVSRELDALTDRITAGTLSHLRATLLPQLTVLENVLVPVLATSAADAGAAERARTLLHQVGLRARLD